MDSSNILNRAIHRGSLKGQRQFENRRVVFFNIISLFLIFSTLAMVSIASQLSSKLLNIAGVVVFLMLYYGHRYKPNLSVLLFGLFYQVFIIIHSSILDVGGQVEYGVFAMTAIVPILFRGRWAYYFLVTNALIFYYPYVFEDAYDSFFKLSYVLAAAIFFAIRAFRVENEKYEQQLLEKQSKLEELSKEKNHLIQVVAHDLKSPLNQIEGWINVIEMTKEDKTKTSSYLSKIVDSVHLMSSMIMRILDVEKIEKGRSIELVPVEIIEILKTVTDQFKVLATYKDLRLDEQFSDNVIWMNGDSHYLQQIFQNVLSNAIKFSPKGKIIKVVAEKSADSVKVKIIDEGPGISSQDQKKLFMKFQKLTAQPTNNEDSTGLGLALTKSFVIAMDGTIICESELGNGAIFTLEFPLGNEPEGT
ncbi:MAG: hypothetical protein DRI71_01390 [Bacteroidetes bacterium]|nr:MAG: hypothetical protein DRI71_01390 [Bacteroidota bacterium]